MKTIKNSFNKIIDEDNIKEAIQTIIRYKKTQKRSKKEIEILKDMEEFPDKYVLKIREILLNSNFKFKPDKLYKIWDNNVKKERIITKPNIYPNQLIHHCIIQIIKEPLEQYFYEYAIACVPNKGTDYGIKTVKKWIRTDIENTQYIFKCDIKHFFQNINREILYNKLYKKFNNDKKLLNLFYKIIYTNEGNGLVLGNYMSPWFANFYLTEFDYFIKHKLKVKYYIRQMDDIVIFSNSKKELHNIKNEVFNYLNNNLMLEIKNDWQIFKFSYYDKIDKKFKGRELNFLGCRFFRYKTILRKRIILSTNKSVQHIKKNGLNIYNSKRIIYYMSWLNKTNCYNFYLKNIKPFVNFKQCKNIISKNSKPTICIKRRDES